MGFVQNISRYAGILGRGAGIYNPGCCRYEDRCARDRTSLPAPRVADVLGGIAGPYPVRQSSILWQPTIFGSQALMVKQLAFNLQNGDRYPGDPPSLRTRIGRAF